MTCNVDVEKDITIFDVRKNKLIFIPKNAFHITFWPQTV